MEIDFGSVRLLEFLLLDSVSCTGGMEISVESFEHDENMKRELSGQKHHPKARKLL